MAITIREMRQSDYEQVILLLAHWNIAPVSPSSEIPHPERSQLIVENTLVAVDGERIVGVRSFIQHSPILGEGASLALDPAYRNQGIGMQLVRAGHRIMRARGIRTIRSEADRPETIRWLVEHVGYHIIGTVPKRHAFGLTEVDHWTVLELDLDTLPELRDLHTK